MPTFDIKSRLYCTLPKQGKGGRKEGSHTKNSPLFLSWRLLEENKIRLLSFFLPSFGCMPLLFRFFLLSKLVSDIVDGIFARLRSLTTKPNPSRQKLNEDSRERERETARYHFSNVPMKKGQKKIQIQTCVRIYTQIKYIQCSPLKRPSDKRPSRLIGHFSQLPNWGFQSNLPG